MKNPAPLWADMTWPDFGEGCESWIAVVPVAATEQHGPHLPLSTDTDIMQGYLARAIDALPADLPATFLPVQSVGLSPEHAGFPGTTTLTPETALRCWTEIGESVARAGLKKMLFLSSHGGNNGLLEAVAREFRARRGMLAVTASFARFGYPKGLFADAEIAHGIHGGEIETSLMLAFRPDLVRTERLKDFPTAGANMAKEFTWLNVGRPAGFAWMTEDLNAEGALGLASSATAEKGRAAAAFGAQALVELLRDMQRFDLKQLSKTPPA